MAKRNITGYSVIAVTLLLTAPPLQAQGTSGLEFLSVPLGARAVALGETYTGVAEGVEGMLFNPAAVTSLRGASVSLSVLHAADLFHQSLIAFGVPVLGDAALGLSVQYQRFEPIPMTDINGDQVGQFSPQTIVVSGTFGYRWGNRLHAGITGKWFQSDLVTGSVPFLGSDFSGSASSVAFDLGLACSFGTDNALRLGVALLDVGPKPTFNRQSDRLPTRLRVGVAAHPIAVLFGAEALGPIDFMIASDGVLRTEEETVTRPSIGYGVELALGRVIYLRAGVPAGSSVDDSRPLRYGVGLKYGVVRFDLARRVTEHPVLGQETHLSASLTF